jgi:hypothetical protein
VPAEPLAAPFPTTPAGRFAVDLTALFAAEAVRFVRLVDLWFTVIKTSSVVSRCRRLAERMIQRRAAAVP